MYVKHLKDVNNQSTFVLYEHGDYKKPLRLLSYHEIIILKGEIEIALEDIFIEAKMTDSN